MLLNPLHLRASELLDSGELIDTSNPHLPSTTAHGVLPHAVKVQDADGMEYPRVPTCGEMERALGLHAGCTETWVQKHSRWATQLERVARMHTEVDGGVSNAVLEITKRILQRGRAL